MTGQINRGSNLGERIFELAKKKEVQNIVDIGTWNGLGSTKCILDAVIGTKKEVYSLECNKLRHEEAKVNLGFLPGNFNLIHGTITDSQELMPLLDTTSDVERGWLEDDINWMRSTPNVMDSLPENIDLCIMDGGEFSGFIEFNKLWKRCKIIVLDDTNKNACVKHCKTREFILENPELFEVIIDDLFDRNGFLICQVLKTE